MSLVLFYIFGVAAVACALTMILARNPVYSALYMIGCLIAVAGEFVLLDAPLLAALQVLVYAGAIMVLYLFVIMLLNLSDDPGFRWWTNWRTYVGLILTGLMGFAAVWKYVANPQAGVAAAGLHHTPARHDHVHRSGHDHADRGAGGAAADGRRWRRLSRTQADRRIGREGRRVTWFRPGTSSS